MEISDLDIEELKKVRDLFLINSEGLKLTKNTKGYGWEIRILELSIDKLEKLNEEMKLRFGDYNED